MHPNMEAGRLSSNFRVSTLTLMARWSLTSVPIRMLLPESAKSFGVLVGVIEAVHV